MSPGTDRHRVVLVYRGPASLPGCPEAVAATVAAAGLVPRYVGPHERLPLDARTLATASAYAQPGGDELGSVWPVLRAAAPTIRSYVAAGGAYLGYCLGAYLAGRDPGFGLLPGDTDQYTASPSATVRGRRGTVVSVRWRDRARMMYFQDGAAIHLWPDAEAEVLARYDNGRPAAAVCGYGRGRVGVVGPHPEATEDWFTDVGLDPPRPLATDLAVDLLTTTLRR
jgi:hypothetical protein